MSDLLTQLKAARRVSVPLVAINTPDPAACILAVCAAINGQAPKVEWDCIRAFRPLNDEAKAFTGKASEDMPPLNPVDAIRIAADLPKDGVLFIHLANRWVNDPLVIQAIWNLRDIYKANHRTLVLLAKHCELPAELSEDVLVFDEPLPSGEQLRGIVAAQFEAANQGLGAKEQLRFDDVTAEKSVEALRGLPAFAAEQIAAMSLTKAGLNVDACWERKRQQIEQTPGLKVFRGGETFADIGGLYQVKQYLTDLMAGNGRPNAIGWIDEAEKAMPGNTNDLSGISQDQLGQMLSYMEDEGVLGVMLLGPPGSGKSAIAKAAGNTAGVPTVRMDMGAMTGSLVGESQAKIRNALKLIASVSDHKAMFIATANSIANLDSALKRRFPFIFYFDLPTREEKDVIWRIWISRFNLDPTDKLPNDDGWSGANIQKCCECAWRLRRLPTDCAKYIVPCARVSAKEIEALRKQADGAFLSASDEGMYRLPKDQPAAESGKRSFTLE